MQLKPAFIQENFSSTAHTKMIFPKVPAAGITSLTNLDR